MIANTHTHTHTATLKEYKFAITSSGGLQNLNSVPVYIDYLDSSSSRHRQAISVNQSWPISNYSQLTCKLNYGSSMKKFETLFTRAPDGSGQSYGLFGLNEDGALIMVSDMSTGSFSVYHVEQ